MSVQRKSAKALRAEMEQIQKDHLAQIEQLKAGYGQSELTLKSKYGMLLKALDDERKNHAEALQKVNSLKTEAVQKAEENARDTLKSAEVTLTSVVNALLLDIKGELMLNMTPEGAKLISKIRELTENAGLAVYQNSLVLQQAKAIGRLTQSGREVPKEYYENIGKLIEKTL